MIGIRSRLSLAQFLSIQTVSELTTIFYKRSVRLEAYLPESDVLKELGIWASRAHEEEVSAILDEVCRSTRRLREPIAKKYIYEERWQDLLGCLLLDGYAVHGDYRSGYSIVALDPVIRDTQPVEDDFTRLLKSSGLTKAPEILRLWDNSAHHFCANPTPDYNASLTEARVALETLAFGIGQARQIQAHKWGALISALRQASLFSSKQEEGLTGVYTFISDGAHVYVGLSLQEMVRLGRSLSAGMSYFLLKQHLALK